MNYGKIKKSDIANGIGVRVSLFVSGCTHHCKGCFNEETWNFNYGEPFTQEVEDHIIELLAPSYVDGLTVLGGEPMEYVNQKVLAPFLKRVRETYPQKTIWCYTGYIYEKDVLHHMMKKWEYTKDMLDCIDVLVDGPYIEEDFQVGLRFRGSTNQRLIDVKKSLAEGSTILWEN